GPKRCGRTLETATQGREGADEARVGRAPGTRTPECRVRRRVRTDRPDRERSGPRRVPVLVVALERAGSDREDRIRRRAVPRDDRRDARARAFALGPRPRLRRSRPGRGRRGGPRARAPTRAARTEPPGPRGV